MATQPKVGTTTCDDTENNDDDHFFCIGKTGASTDLSKIFKAAATQLAKGKSHLVNLYPIPVVTAVSPSSGSHNGGTSVTVSGSFFTGATTVTFNGLSVPFTVVNDTTITATAPPGATGTTVDIFVTTPGGTTSQVSGDRFTYT